MRTKNLRVINQLTIAGCRGSEAMGYYFKARSKSMFPDDWCDITDPRVVDPNLLDRFCGMRVKPFEVRILSYETSKWHHYMDYKRALSLMAKMGCRPLNLVQTLFVACQTIRTGEIRDVVLANNYRDLVSIVPTNPEFARFYYFARMRLDSGAFGAGRYVSGKFEERNPKGKKVFYDWEAVLDIDLRSPLLLCEKIS